METTYTMIGADGLHYGPVTLEQVRGWIAEGRVVADTKISRSDTQSWLPASSYVELGIVPAPAAPPSVPRTIGPAPAGNAEAMRVAVMERRVASSASWFYWVAGLSAINTLNLGIQFFFGTLGMTAIIDAMASERNMDRSIVFALNLIVAGLYVLFGVFASRRQIWAFVVGGIIYAIDTLIFVVAKDWLVVAFHVFVLFRVFRGFKVSLELNKQTR